MTPKPGRGARRPAHDRSPSDKPRSESPDRATPAPGTPPPPPQDEVPRTHQDDAPRTHQDDAPLIPERSRDDSDAGWNDGPDSNDERLRRDVPPHW
jgi:hypothetical protein